MRRRKEAGLIRAGSAVVDHAAAEGEAGRRPIVPRRKVPAIIRMVDGVAMVGDLYVAVSGAGSSVADRLNDDGEAFLPLATDDRHLLLRKSSILTVLVAGCDAGDDEGKGPVARAYPVELRLLDGSHLRGAFRAPFVGPHERTLDHLNGLSSAFLPLWTPAGLVLVNACRVALAADLRDPR